MDTQKKLEDLLHTAAILEAVTNPAAMWEEVHTLAINAAMTAMDAALQGAATNPNLAIKSHTIVIVMVEYTALMWEDDHTIAIVAMNIAAT